MKRFYLVLLSLFTVFAPAFAAESVKYNKELDGFNYPFEVQTFNFNSQSKDLAMRYMDVGAKDAKKVIVLLHGKNFSGYY